MIYRNLYYTALTCALGMFACCSLFVACDLLDPSPEGTIVRPPELDCDDLTPLSGMEIYRCKCAICHGLDGESVTDQITDIRNFTSFTDFETALDTGPGTMPLYPEIGADERTRLFEYVRDSLGK